MNSRRSFLALVSAGLLLLAPAISDAAVVVRRGPNHPRRTVVIHQAHPLRRPMPAAIVVRPAVTVRVTPARFLPVVAWTAVAVARPAPDRIVWQDAETLSRDEEWAEIVFNSEQRGEKLYLEVVSGRVRFDFAEVVFENGDCQVVDFNDRVHRPGFYSLLDFANGRRVDHVRLVARAVSDDARIALLLRK